MTVAQAPARQPADGARRAGDADPATQSGAKPTRLTRRGGGGPLGCRLAKKLDRGDQLLISARDAIGQFTLDDKHHDELTSGLVGEEVIGPLDGNLRRPPLGNHAKDSIAQLVDALPRRGESAESGAESRLDIRLEFRKGGQFAGFDPRRRRDVALGDELSGLVAADHGFSSSRVTNQRPIVQTASAGG